ncbi:MAG TPA: SGNH/GDSL hydrolase family protein, partial [Blastocatellia bacterium]
YYPRIPDPFMRKIAVAALATFNDVIIRQAFLAGVPLIDLRLVCDEDSDYANEIEPSEKGGGKIASAVARLVSEHNFEKRRTEVFF